MCIKVVQSANIPDSSECRMDWCAHESVRTIALEPRRGAIHDLEQHRNNDGCLQRLPQEDEECHKTEHVLK